jgi:hypothetical protein
MSYGTGSSSKWIDIPICYTGVVINYRISSLKQAGFSEFPATTDEFLEYAKATKKNNTPGGFALGHASGDANAWVHWCLWAHGGDGRHVRELLHRPRGRERCNQECGAATAAHLSLEEASVLSAVAHDLPRRVYRNVIVKVRVAAFGLCRPSLPLGQSGIWSEADAFAASQ